MTDLRVYYQDKLGVQVTDSNLLIKKKSFQIANIFSARVGRSPNMLGVCCTLPFIAFGIWGVINPGEDYGAVAFYNLTVGVAALIGFISSMNYHKLLLITQFNKIDVLRSQDKRYLQIIAGAIDVSIADSRHRELAS